MNAALAASLVFLLYAATSISDAHGLDLGSTSVTVLHSCASPQAVAADPVRQLVYASCIFYPKPGGVFVINSTTGDTKQLLSDSTCDSAMSIVVDLQTHDAYVACDADSNDPSTAVAVWRVNGFTYEVTAIATVAECVNAMEVWLDQSESRVYVTCSNAIASFPTNSTLQPPPITFIPLSSKEWRCDIVQTVLIAHSPDWRLVISCGNIDQTFPILAFNRSMELIAQLTPDFICGAMAMTWDASFPDVAFAACGTSYGVIALNLTNSAPMVQPPYYFANQTQCVSPQALAIEKGSLFGPSRLFSSCANDKGANDEGSVMVQDLDLSGSLPLPFLNCGVVTSISPVGPVGSGSPIYVACDSAIVKVTASFHDFGPFRK